MKTDIVYKYNLEKGFTIQKILPIDDSNCVVLISKWPDIIKVEIVGENPKTFIISEYSEISKGVSYKSFFKYKDGFGLMDYTETILLWTDIFSEPKLLKIENPFLTDEHGRKNYTLQASCDNLSNSLFFAIEDKGHSGFPAKFWSKLILNNNNSLATITYDTVLRWSSLNKLDLNNYPTTWYRTYHPNDEWLNICDLMKKGNRIYVHTNGGKATRLKSGPQSEFSIITVLTDDNTFI